MISKHKSSQDLLSHTQDQCPLHIVFSSLSLLILDSPWIINQKVMLRKFFKSHLFGRVSLDSHEKLLLSESFFSIVLSTSKCQWTWTRTWARDRTRTRTGGWGRGRAGSGNITGNRGFSSGTRVWGGTRTRERARRKCNTQWKREAEWGSEWKRQLLCIQHILSKQHFREGGERGQVNQWQWNW